MALVSKKNNAKSKVASVGGIDASTNPVTFNVTTGEGTKFPASNFKISIDNEIMLCTTRTGDALTCSRAQESTTIASHSQNADVELRITAGTLEEYDNVLKGTSTASEGEKILLDDLSVAPTTPSANHRQLYFRGGQAYQMGSDGVESSVGGGGASYWTAMPGTVTRVSDTQFTIPDASNTLKLDKLFGKGCLLRWDESGTTQLAMSKGASYSGGVVTVNIVGNSLTAGFSSMKYCLNQAVKNAGETPMLFPMPTVGATDISKTIYLPEEMYIISYDFRLKSAGSGTGSTIADLNANGTTLATTKATITGTDTSDLDNVCDGVSGNTLTATAKDSAITVDVDSLTSTVPTSDGYVDFYGMPVSWLYR